MNHQRDSLQDEPGVRVKAHPGLCLGYGNCHRFAPDVYELDDEGMIDVHLLEVPSSLALQAWIGATVCPERAITVIGPAEEHWRQRQRAESAPKHPLREERSIAMSSINGDSTLGECVNQHPEAARIFEAAQLDYCCGGGATLRDACREKGIELEVIERQLNDLSSVEDGAESSTDWASLSPTELVDHLEDTHHRYLRSEFDRIEALAHKVATVHRDRHPELDHIAELYGELRADLEPHLAKEEQILFPMIRELSSAHESPQLHCGSIGNPISRMMIEHEAAGALLSELRSVTSHYQPPADGCASYTALFAALSELERDTHLHIHKENNLLFPAVVALEQSLLCPPTASTDDGETTAERDGRATLVDGHRE